jgi:S1-C subfamily serine protease
MPLKLLCPALLALFLVCGFASAQTKDLQSQLVGLAPTASDAVIPISVWFDILKPSNGQQPVNMTVVGTGFFVNSKGDFITAGHVIDSLDELKKDPKVANARLTATLRQRRDEGGAMAFKIIDRDWDHDLVLCHLPGINGLVPLKATFINGGNVDVAHPFASLAISTAVPVTGRFVVVSGFPLGSWTPAVQLGSIAATKTLTPLGMFSSLIHRDGGELLQVSVNANHGNSGGPVIDLYTGKVVGVIDQIVPAPLQFGGLQILQPGTFSASGIMLVSPAKWVEALLEKNRIKSEAIAGGKFMTGY